MQPVKFFVDGEWVKDIEDKVLEAVEEAKLETAEGDIPVRKPDRYLTNQLRKSDPDDKHTCAVCQKRLPLNNFKRFKQSDVCLACEE